MPEDVYALESHSPWYCIMAVFELSHELIFCRQIKLNNARQKSRAWYVWEMGIIAALAKTSSDFVISSPGKLYVTVRVEDTHF